MAKVTGLDQVLRSLEKEISGIEKGLFNGVRKASILVQGDAMDMAPVDYGVLMNSAFSDAEMTAKGPAGRVGFTAKYAPWVHEMPMTLKGQPRADFGKTGNQSEFGPQQVISFGGGSNRGVYWSGGENKFLEKSAKNNSNTIFEIIHKAAKV